jgi:hypothetical protein
VRPEGLGKFIKMIAVTERTKEMRNFVRFSRFTNKCCEEKCCHEMTRKYLNFKDRGLQSEVDKIPWPLVRKRTIPTDRPPLVDEI